MIPIFLDQVDKVIFLRDLSPFAGLGHADLEALARDFHPRKYKKNDIIFHEQDQGRSLYVIMKGKVRVFHLSPRGDETTVAILVTGQVVGEFAAIDDKPRLASAKTLEDCLLLEITQDRFWYHMRTIPEMAIGMCKLVVEKARWASLVAHLMAQYTAPGRLLYLLLHYNEQFGREIEADKLYELDLGLNHVDLASMSGVRRERISSILQDWRKRHLVEYTQGSKIIILNLPHALEELQRQLKANQEE